MDFVRLKKFCCRIRNDGVVQTGTIVVRRVHDRAQTARWRKRVEQKSAESSWQTIATRHGKDHAFFTVWDLLSTALAFSADILGLVPDATRSIVEKADEYVDGYWHALGSPRVRTPEPPWHTDIRLGHTNPEQVAHFETELFYKDIAITSHSGAGLGRDIKVPWEIGRFQHLTQLGQAHMVTGDPRYSETFTAHINSWIVRNPYMRGVHWVCPMEVGIRAINWIWGFIYFKNSPHVTTTTWERFVCSLYDHGVYLAHNLEFYDGRTNNHLLSDLVGYLYICWYFQDFSGFAASIGWCTKLLFAEFERQIWLEGTDYEGSTGYHGFVAILLYHTLFLCRELGIPVSPFWYTRMYSMLSFMSYCSPALASGGVYRILIGDFDASMIGGAPSLPGMSLDIEPCRLIGVREFRQFGLSILADEQVHLTLRHHVYDRRQPTGHFHNDMGSITLVIGGIPLFVDPGTYVYTASSVLRNAYRSVAVHNTACLVDRSGEVLEPVPFDERLFALAIPEGFYRGVVTHNSMATHHTLYARYGYSFARRVTWHADAATVEIDDVWHAERDAPPMQAQWNFTLHPAVRAYYENDAIVLEAADKKFVVRSTLPLEIVPGFIAPTYGEQQETQCIRMREHRVSGCAVWVRSII